MHPCLLDTNILVYAFAQDDTRSRAAQELILSLQDSRLLRTSTQTLQEFFVVSTRKVKRPLTASQALAVIEELSESPVIVNDVDTIRSAVHLSSKHPISFWDSLLVCSAVQAGVGTLYTEDLQHGSNLLGIRIVNPFVS